MLRLFWALADLGGRSWRWLGALPREAAIALGAPAAGRPARPERLAQAMLVILPLALFAALLMPRITLVMTPSIEAWAVRPSPGPIARGDYVMFTLRDPIAGPRPVQVTKHALCLPGDWLTLSETPSHLIAGALDGHFYCNGQLLGISMAIAGNGMRLRHMRWSGIVPPGRVYVGSRHARGYDSRYIGLLPISALTRMERIL